MKITLICLIWDQTFANVDVLTLILFPITVVLSTYQTDNIRNKNAYSVSYRCNNGQWYSANGIHLVDGIHTNDLVE